MSNKNKRSLRKDWHMIKRAVGILNEIMSHFWLWQAVCALFEAFTPYFGVYMSALMVNELAGDCNIEKLLSYAAISAIGIFVISIITRLLQRQRTIKDYMLWQQHEAYIIRAQNHLQYEHLENPDVVLRRSKIFSAFNATGGGLPVVKWSVQVILSSVLNIIFSVSLTISMFSMAAEGEFTGIWAIVNSPLSSAIIILLIAVNTVLSVKLSAYTTAKMNEAVSDLAHSNTRYGAYMRLWGSDMTVFAIQDHVGYFITPIFHYYGIVRAHEVTVILGPTRQVSATEQELKDLAFAADVPSEDTEDFVLAMQNIVHMPLDSILQILFTMNHILNGEKLSLKDLKIYDADQEKLKHLLEEEATTTSYEHQKAPDHFDNNSFALEQTLMNIVRHGDTASLRQWIASAPAVQSGVLAHDYLRQIKNTFIVSVTLVCRNAIRGGMDVHDALSLSDSYIQKCELMSSMEEISNLQYCMVLEYTERVERIRRGKQPTKLTVDVTNYVLHHLSEPIRTEDIASSVFLSRTRLSAKFKEETGVTLTDYILKEKAIEGKRLLRYTDKSITAISEHLGFSSPAHFSRVFKKYIGVTPKEYREKKQ